MKSKGQKEKRYHDERRLKIMRLFETSEENEDEEMNLIKDLEKERFVVNFIH